jgi:lipoprotein-anchoring transpeptidase ErfK/SrfK
MEAAALTRPRRSRSPRRLPVLAVLLVVIPLAIALAVAWAFESARADRIAHGVRIAGIDVGGLSSDAAYLRVQDHFYGRLHRNVVIHSAARDYTLTAQAAGVALNTQAMVAGALAASHHGNFLAQAARDAFGASVSADVRAQLTYSPAAVAAIVAQIAKDSGRPARNAAVVPSASGLTETPAANGIAVDTTLLARRIAHAFLEPTAPRGPIVVPTSVALPTLTEGGLAAAYPAYIVVDRAHFALRFFQNLKLTRTYEIAVGMQGLETPTGLYNVQWKEVDPPWHVPDSAWAGSLAGQTIPPGPADPIKARWMAFDGGAGIHGIAPSEYSSIGHMASHGCVRMRIPDVISLYKMTPVGTPVFVA